MAALCDQLGLTAASVASPEAAGPAAPSCAVQGSPPPAAVALSAAAEIGPPPVEKAVLCTPPKGGRRDHGAVHGDDARAACSGVLGGDSQSGRGE
eukprot:3274411-Pyramimonas_sp.AAC.1